MKSSNSTVSSPTKKNASKKIEKQPLASGDSALSSPSTSPSISPARPDTSCATPLEPVLGSSSYSPTGLPSSANNTATATSAIAAGRSATAGASVIVDSSQPPSSSAAIPRHSLGSLYMAEEYANVVAIVNPKSGERQASDFVYESLSEILSDRHKIHRLDAASFRDTTAMRELVKSYCVWFVDDIVADIPIEEAMAEVELVDGNLSKVMALLPAAIRNRNVAGGSPALAAAADNTTGGFVSDASRAVLAADIYAVDNASMTAATAQQRRKSSSASPSSPHAHRQQQQEERGTVIVAGGDGTVCFIMSVLDDVRDELEPKGEADRMASLRTAIATFLAAHPVMVPKELNRKGEVILPNTSFSSTSPSNNANNSATAAAGGGGGGAFSSSSHHHQSSASPPANTISYKAPRLVMPAIGVIAMGTGNDFSNHLGYGLGYTKYPAPPCCLCCCDCCVHRVKEIVDSLVKDADAVPFDRWHVTVTPIRELVADVVTESEFESKDAPISTAANNAKDNSSGNKAVSAAAPANAGYAASASNHLSPSASASQAIPANARHRTLSIAFDSQQMGYGSAQRAATASANGTAHSRTVSDVIVARGALAANNSRPLSGLNYASGEVVVSPPIAADLRAALHVGDARASYVAGAAAGGSSSTSSSPLTRKAKGTERQRTIVTVDSQRLRRHQYGAAKAGAIGNNNGGGGATGTAATGNSNAVSRRGSSGNLAFATSSYNFVAGTGAGSPLFEHSASMGGGTASLLAASPNAIPTTPDGKGGGADGDTVARLSVPTASAAHNTSASRNRTASQLVVEDTTNRRKSVIIAHDATANIHNKEGSSSPNIMTACPTMILSSPSQIMTAPHPSTFSADPAKGPKKSRQFIAMNYFSLGMDALIATTFDTLRKKHPSLFNSRVMNKMWYGSLGLYGWAKSDRLDDSVYYIDVATEEGIFGGNSGSGRGGKGAAGTMQQQQRASAASPYAMRTKLRERRRNAEKRRHQKKAAAQQQQKNNSNSNSNGTALAAVDSVVVAAASSPPPREAGGEAEAAAATALVGVPPVPVRGGALSSGVSDGEEMTDTPTTSAMMNSSGGAPNVKKNASYDDVLPPDAATPTAQQKGNHTTVVNANISSSPIVLLTDDDDAFEGDSASDDDDHDGDDGANPSGGRGGAAVPPPTPVSLPSKSKCLVMSNVGSYSGGAKLWAAGGDKKVKKAAAAKKGLLDKIRSATGGGGGGGASNAMTIHSNSSPLDYNANGGGIGGSNDNGDVDHCSTGLSNPFDDLTKDELALLNGASSKGYTHVSTSDGLIEMQAVGGLMDMMMLQSKLTPTTKMAQSQVVRIVVGHPEHHPSRIANKMAELAAELSRKEKLYARELQPTARKIAMSQYQSQARKALKAAKEHRNNLAAVPAGLAPYLDNNKRDALIDAHYRAIVLKDRDIVSCTARIAEIRGLLEVMPDWAVVGGGSSGVADASSSCPPIPNADRIRQQPVKAVAKHRPTCLEEALAAAIHCELPDEELRVKGALQQKRKDSNTNTTNGYTNNGGVGAGPSASALSLNTTFEKAVCFQVDGEPSGYVTEPSLIEVRPYPREMLVRSLTHTTAKRK